MPVSYLVFGGVLHILFLLPPCPLFVPVLMMVSFPLLSRIDAKDGATGESFSFFCLCLTLPTCRCFLGVVAAPTVALP